MSKTFLTGDRLLEERKRLGLSQSAMGALAGVSKMSQINYESGARSPGADYLAAIASSGADVQYIVTGIRSAQALSPDESLLLDRYRASPRELRDAALRVLLGGDGPTTSKARKIKQTVSGNANQVVGVNQGVVNDGDRSSGTRGKRRG